MISSYAIVECQENIGINSNVWHFTHIRSTAKIGSYTNIGSHCYIDKEVTIGDKCKIQNGCNIYHPAKIGSCVFIGPGAMLINDKHPKATKENGDILTDVDWFCQGVVIEDFVNIGAGAIIMPGVKIGRNSTIGAGSVVTKDVPSNTIYMGNPARSKKNNASNN